MSKVESHKDETAMEGGPLTGCRVVELGSTVAGPFCARLLADFGADVIKVEQPTGDAVRFMAKRKEDRSLYATSILRNKRNVCIDMRSERGSELVRRLCRRADIVIENFRPGTLERWGLGYEQLSANNKGLILVRISGYGQTGPYSSRPGYGVVCEAVSGLRGITGDPDRPPPRIATSVTDYITGLYAAFGAVLALLARPMSGMGQVIDAALYESAFTFMEPHIAAFQQLGYVAQRAGPGLPGSVPNSLYPTADGKYIIIAAGAQSVFGRLLDVMRQKELLMNPHYATPLARSQHEEEVNATVASWTNTLSLSELEQCLNEAAVPASRIYDMADIFGDPHYQARNMLVERNDPVLGQVTMANVVPRLSATPGQVKWAGRDTGEDTSDVLATELGLSSSEIEQLIEANVISLRTRGKSTG